MKICVCFWYQNDFGACARLNEGSRSGASLDKHHSWQHRLQPPLPLLVHMLAHLSLGV
jgi:hypothetical protein